MKAFPTNFLRTTPEGKLADLEDLIGLGIVDERSGGTYGLPRHRVCYDIQKRAI